MSSHKTQWPGSGSPQLSQSACGMCVYLPTFHKLTINMLELFLTLGTSGRLGSAERNVRQDSMLACCLFIS